MGGYTRFTKLEATSDILTPELEATTEIKAPKITSTAKLLTPEIRITEALDDENCKVVFEDVAGAAGDAPTAEEYAAAIDAINDLKAKHNALLLALQTGVSTEPEPPEI